VWGSPTALKTAPHAPFRVEGVWRDVADPLPIGEATFATRIDRDLLLVAETPEGDPKRKVRSGATLKIAWTEGGKKRASKFRFVRNEDGTWRYYAAEVMRFKLGRAQLALVDADADGVHGEFGVDGILLGSTTHVIPLQQEMLIGLQMVKFVQIDAAGTAIRATRRALEGGKAQLATLAFLNYLRRAHGLSPVLLDEEFSRGCTAHAEYLTESGWNGTDDPHDQDPKHPKASAEGQAAAGVSVIMKMPAIASVRAHYLTYYHRMGMLHPRLTRVGINGTMPTLTVVDVYRGRAKGEAGAALHDRPWFCPADGVVGLPSGSHSEIPREPVSNLGARGFPLMVWFPEAGGPITEFKGTLFRGKAGRTPVSGLIVKPDDKGVAGLVPAKPLDSRTRYVARFSWTRGGKSHTRRIHFRTG